MKKVETTIYCDTCNMDISPKITLYPNQYILRVSVFDIAVHDPKNIIYDILMVPPIEDDLFFCGRDCMRGYKG